MKVSGSILLDKRGSFPHVHKHNISYAVDDFVSMVKEADACKDTLYYDSEDWELFYAYGYDPTNDYWKEFGSIAYEQLFISSNPLFKPIQIGEKDKFENKPMPRTLGGFMCVGCPKSDYIYDKSTIDKWHNQWFKDNPDKIDWTNTNGIMPCYDRIITILRSELTKLKDNPDLICGLTHIETLYLASVDIELLNDVEVVSKFYSLIMDHKAEDGERIAYAKDIGAKICTANFYHEEPELKTLNKDKSQIVAIYSIKKEGKYQFLSIDKKHGRFEWCNENGNHICEIMFDSTIVENSTDASHSIEHIDDWKRIYHK